MSCACSDDFAFVTATGAPQASDLQRPVSTGVLAMLSPEEPVDEFEVTVYLPDESVPDDGPAVPEGLGGVCFESDGDSEVGQTPEFRLSAYAPVAAAGPRVSRVQGACTAAFYDADVSAGTPWLATEYVRGLSLRGHVRENGVLTGGVLLALAGGLVGTPGWAAPELIDLVRRSLDKDPGRRPTAEQALTELTSRWSATRVQQVPHDQPIPPSPAIAPGPRSGREGATTLNGPGRVAQARQLALDAIGPYYRNPDADPSMTDHVYRDRLVADFELAAEAEDGVEYLGTSDAPVTLQYPLLFTVFSEPDHGSGPEPTINTKVYLSFNEDVDIEVPDESQIESGRPSGF